MTDAGSDTHAKATAAFTAIQTSSGLIPGSAIANLGVDTAQIAAEAVTTAKIEDEAVTPAKLALDDLGAAEQVVDHADGAATTLLTAPASVALAFVCTVKCTETVVNGGGGAPTWTAGNGTAADHFVASTEYAAAATAGNRFTFGGKLEPGETLDITPTDGTGGDAGAFQHDVVATPVTETP